jgi:predicted dithiol-disulfide oxidoreductase (DUF899 family)
MPEHTVGTQEQWQAEHDELRRQEKELTRRGDELARKRRELPWVPLDSDYRFDTEAGQKTLAELFDGRSQLLVYHFMFGPPYEAGCPVCSSIADTLDPQVVHLKARDTTLLLASRAPLDRLLAFRERMGWGIDWVSSGRSDFNRDLGFLNTADELKPFLEGEIPSTVEQNARICGTDAAGYVAERPGLSAYALSDGVVYLGWFTGVWVVMMAAMMLPSLAPAAAVHAAVLRRGPGRVLLFTCGYLLVWSAAGVVAYGLFELGKGLFGGTLAWHSGGRWLAAGVLVLAALYQLTPYKRAFLSRCREPVLLLRATWRDSRSGAFAMGLRSGQWCLGCSWALMAALFALGVMSLTWMALIAGLVALEKVGPRAPAARVLTAGVLLVLAVAILAVPQQLPGFVDPGSSGAMHGMTAMNTTG